MYVIITNLLVIDNGLKLKQKPEPSRGGLGSSFPGKPFDLLTYTDLLPVEKHSVPSFSPQLFPNSLMAHVGQGEGASVGIVVDVHSGSPYEKSARTLHAKD